MNIESAAKRSKNGVGGDVRSKMKYNGRKRKATVLDNLDDMLKIPKIMKNSQVKLAAATSLSQSTISRRYHSADLKRSNLQLLPHQQTSKD